MKDQDIENRIHQLKLEHGDLDAAIILMSEALFIDQLQLKRMKIRKLRLKDEIIVLESKLIPDIEA